MYLVSSRFCWVSSRLKNIFLCPYQQETSPSSHYLCETGFSPSTSNTTCFSTQFLPNSQSSKNLNSRSYFQGPVQCWLEQKSHHILFRRLSQKPRRRCQKLCDSWMVSSAMLTKVLTDIAGSVDIALMRIFWLARLVLFSTSSMRNLNLVKFNILKTKSFRPDLHKIKKICWWINLIFFWYWKYITNQSQD